MKEEEKKDGREKRARELEILNVMLFVHSYKKNPNIYLVSGPNLQQLMPSITKTKC